MIIYFKYFFMFPRISHYYLYFFWTFDHFFKFNVYFILTLKKKVLNYSSTLFSWLRVFKKTFISNNVKSLTFNYLTSNMQTNFLSNKRSFSNILLKNGLSGDVLSFNLQLSSVYTLLFTYDNFFMFIGNKVNSVDYNKLFLNLKFNYFLLLINCNWHLILNVNNIFSSIRYSIISIIKLKGMRQYGLYSTTFLWKFWSNFFLLIINISFYNISILSFSKIYFRKIVEPFNWLSWSWSFNFWKVISKGFFYKYGSRGKNSSNFFVNLKNWFYGIVFILDSNFHYNILHFCNKLSIFNFALLDTNHEPWLSWYPIPSRASDITLQYLFLILTLKIRIMGQSLYFYFKLYFIFLLRLVNLLLYINHSLQSLVIL